MMTYEMIGVADENGRTYESKYGTYNREEGFMFNDETFEYPREVFCGILLHEDLWRLKVDKKKMTLDDIEKALGYKVEIVEDKKKPVPPKCTSAETPKPKKRQIFFDDLLDELLKA